jgi:hypothetical protein
MRNNFYNQSTNIIAHHYFNGNKDHNNRVRYNMSIGSPYVATANLTRRNEEIKDGGGYQGAMKKPGDKSATDKQTYVISSLGELDGPLRGGQSGQTLDLRDHNISPDVYMALARGQKVEVELQQMAPERVNLFTPMLAAAMQIIGGAGGGVAYNEDLTQVISGGKTTGRGDGGQLGKAADFVNKHGSAYDLGLGTGEHIDVVAKFRILNEEKPNKPEQVVHVPPYKPVSDNRKDINKPSPDQENVDVPGISKPNEVRDYKQETTTRDANPQVKTQQPVTIDPATGKVVTETPHGEKAPILTLEPGKVATTIPDVIDPKFFKLMNTTKGYQTTFDWEAAAKSAGVTVDELRKTLNDSGINPDDIAAKMPKEANVSDFLQRYNKGREDIVANDNKGTLKGTYRDDGNGNTINSAVIMDLDIDGLSKGGYTFNLDLKGKAVSDYVKTASDATDAFDNGVGVFERDAQGNLHPGVTEADVKKAQEILSKYPGKNPGELLNPEELLKIAKGLEKTNPKEAASIYAALFLQVENNTGVENGHLGAGHVNKLREAVVDRANVFVDGTRAINTLVNSSGVTFPLNVNNLSTSLAGNQEEIGEQSKGLKTMVALYNKANPGANINPENITKEQALDLLKFSEGKLKTIQNTLSQDKGQGYIKADSEFAVITAQIDGVIGKPDLNLRDGNNSGMGALRTLINNGTNQVGTTASKDAKEYNQIATKQQANPDKPLSQGDVDKLTELAQSSDPKVAEAAQTMLSNNNKLNDAITVAMNNTISGAASQQKAIDASQGAILLNNLAQGKVSLPLSTQDSETLKKAGVSETTISKINSGSVEAISNGLVEIKSTIVDKDGKPIPDKNGKVNQDVPKLASQIDSAIAYVNSKPQNISSNLDNVSTEVNKFGKNAIVSESGKTKFNDSMNKIEQDLISQIPQELRATLAPNGKIDSEAVKKFLADPANSGKIDKSLSDNLTKFSEVKSKVGELTSRSVNDVSLGKDEFNLMIGAREYLDPFVKDLESKGVDISALKTNGKIDYKKVLDFANALQGLDPSQIPSDSPFKSTFEQVVNLEPKENSTSLIDGAKNINHKFSKESGLDLDKTADQEAVDVIKSFDLANKSGVVDIINEPITKFASSVHINKSSLTDPNIQKMVSGSFDIALQAGLITQDDIAKLGKPPSPDKMFDLFKKVENKLSEMYNPNHDPSKINLTTDLMFGAFHITNLQRALYDKTQTVVGGVQALDKLYEGKALSPEQEKSLQGLLDEYNKTNTPPITREQLGTDKDLAVKLLDFSEKKLDDISKSIGKFEAYGQLKELKADIAGVIGNEGSKSGIASLRKLMTSGAQINPDQMSPSNQKKVNDFQTNIESEITYVEDAIKKGITSINGKSTADYLKELKTKYMEFKKDFNLPDSKTSATIARFDKSIEDASKLPAPTTPTGSRESNAKEYKQGLEKTLNAMRQAIANGQTTINVDNDGDGKGDGSIKISDYIKKLESDYQAFLFNSTSDEHSDIESMAKLFSQVHLEAGLTGANGSYKEVTDLALAIEAVGNINVDNLFGQKPGQTTIESSNDLTYRMIGNISIGKLSDKLDECFDQETGKVDSEKLNKILGANFKNFTEQQVLEFFAISERLLKKAGVDPVPDLTKQFQDAVKTGKDVTSAMNQVLEPYKPKKEESRIQGLSSDSSNELSFDGNDKRVVNTNPTPVSSGEVVNPNPTPVSSGEVVNPNPTPVSSGEVVNPNPTPNNTENTDNEQPDIHTPVVTNDDGDKITFVDSSYTSSDDFLNGNFGPRTLGNQNIGMA